MLIERPMTELPSGTVTFLFTDIEGSTRLLKQLGERYGEARADHHRLLRAAFEEHGGQEIDTQGDAFFVAFQRAKDAVAAAAAAQRALHTHEWPAGAPLRVRMGMHTGEPSVSEEGYLGLGVHRAARICSAGHGGQVLLSQATVVLLEDEELPGIEIRDLGRHQLKDIDRPERIYQLVLPDLPDTFPPLKAVQAQPDQATPFEGREGELAEAAASAIAQPWYRTRARVLALAGVVVAALVTGAALLFSGGSSALSRIDSDSAGLIDASSNKIKKQVAVGSSPGAVAAGANAIWMAIGDAVSRIDPEANIVTQTIPLDSPPTAIAFGGGALWVVSSEERGLRKIGPSANRVGERIPVGNGPGAVAVAGGAVWVANRLDDTVSRVSIGDRGKRVFRAGLTPSGLAVDKTAVWVSNEAVGAVSRLDPATGAVQTINVGNGPGGIAVGYGSVWVANSLDDTVSRIDPRTNTVSSTIRVGRGPDAVAVGSGSIWVTNRFGGTVSRIDPEANRVVKTIKVGESPGGIAFTKDGVWVSARGPLTSHRGGTLTILGTPDDIDSIDPAVAYHEYSWQIVTMTNDALLTFKRVEGAEGTQLVPDLATAVPRPSGGGTSYTFQLRPGIHYSTGRLVRASDVRSSFERFFRIRPAAGYFRSIVGAASCETVPRRCDLRRGIVADDSSGTVTFRLTRPDYEFLYQLAVPLASIVPAETPAREARTGREVAATGPYRIASFLPDRKVTLRRNPRFHEWSPDAQPRGFPDRIVFDLTKSPSAQVTAIERGRADLTSGLLPPERLEELTTRYAEQLHVNSRPQTFMIFLNTVVSPFDRADVRRAVNFAFDRARWNQLFQGPLQLQPTCQILPANFAGYRPYCPYTLHPDKAGNGTWTAPDLDRARSLVRRSGTRGAKVTILSSADPERNDTKASQYVASLLHQLGYRASIRAAPSIGEYFEQVMNPRSRVQAGTFGWLADYPAASAFMTPLVRCTPPNVARFCNRRIESEVTRALRVQASDPTAASSLWARIDREVADEAPYVATGIAKELGFVSRRVGNYQHNAQWGVLVDQLWVR
jgi:YVTN family beta-propeller protein